MTRPSKKRPLQGSRQYAPEGKDRNPDEKHVEEVVESRSPIRPFFGSAHCEAYRDERGYVRKDDPENRSHEVQILDNEQPPIEENDKQSDGNQ